MSISLSVKKQCSRCPRVEQKDITIEEAVKLAKDTKKQPPALEVFLEGESLGSFELLCDTCQTIIARYLENTMKRPKHQSSLREQSEEPDVKIEQG